MGLGMDLLIGEEVSLPMLKEWMRNGLVKQLKVVGRLSCRLRWGCGRAWTLKMRLKMILASVRKR